MAAPTPVSALVHSSTLVTAGIYLIIRFFPTLGIFHITKFICFYLGAITCIIARSSAMFENDLKKIIALSTLRQLGVIIIALGLEQPGLAFFHLITHALFKALLFICAGTMIHLETNNQDIRLIGNLESISPITIVIFNRANLSLCGMPFLAGFYSKDRIIETFFMRSQPLTSRIIIILRVCMTSAYTMRVALFTIWLPRTRLNFRQSCRKHTYLAYTILILGTIMGGATIN
jgi:NADH-ubiquinone oxidoreductase chain 5